MAAHAHPTAPLDQMDPHHEIEHHGHVIIRPRTLIAVLVALLFFTVLTVAFAQAEIWFTHAFGVAIPQLVNVAIALSIAVVKTLLVGMFFMQLRYDNPLNSLVMLFCLFAFALFLFFSMTDLGTRGILYPYKAGEIQRGGLGGALSGVDTGTMGIVAYAKHRRIEQIAELNQQGKLAPPLAVGEEPLDRWAKEAAAEHAAHGGAHKHEPEGSTANRSIPPTPGPTPGLYEPNTETSHGGAPAHGH
jgi:cytochrome c oxidase subunit IV